MSFQVGDRVKVVHLIENDYGKPYLPISLLGQTGIVVGYHPLSWTDSPYDVKLDDTGIIEYFNLVELELV
jgi:hypothetical protein